MVAVYSIIITTVYVLTHEHKTNLFGCKLKMPPAMHIISNHTEERINLRLRRDRRTLACYIRIYVYIACYILHRYPSNHYISVT